MKIKAVTILLLALSTHAEKKIELQDIEEDNLKSEKEKDYDKADTKTNSDSDQDLIPLDFLKNGFLRYFDRSSMQPQQTRYVHQYAVNEPAESPNIAHKSQLSLPSGPSQAMVGYLSNVPMQIYLVPQYYSEPSEQGINNQGSVQYTAPSAVARVSSYTAPEATQPPSNYIEVPAYVMPSGKAYVPQYAPQVTYVTYGQQATPAPAPATPHVVVTSPSTGPGSQQPSAFYQMPVYQYQTALSSAPPKGYYQTAQYTETNTVEEPFENEVESPKNYVTQTETPFPKPSNQQYPRYYTSARTPVREEYRPNGAVTELPHPNPLLLRGMPHQIPKALPMYRPLSKSVYSGAGYLPNGITQKPLDGYSYFKKRPTSLLDSYIPSSVQLEYLRRGYSKDPLSAYEALASGRNLYSHSVTPRHYERGFLPNQMYHTAAGGITYGHYKRTPKPDKLIQK